MKEMSKFGLNSYFVKQNHFNDNCNQRHPKHNQLDGHEIQEFYHNIISSAEESKAKNRKKCKPVSKTHEETHGRFISDNGIKCDQIFKMCQNGDYNGCVQWIRMGYDINTTDQYLWTPLMCSSCAGHQDIVQLLLDNKADIGPKDKRGRSAYDLALISGHKHICDLIINRQKKTQTRNEVNNKLDSIGSSDSSRDPKRCDVCGYQYNGCDVRHKCSIVHQISAESGQNFNKYYEISESNKGFQMLLRSGWSRSEGLGPKGHGMRAPVKTVLKRDRLGLGLSDTKNKPKVTHFSSFDPKSVDNNVKHNRLSKERQRRQSEIRFKQMEIRFRQEFK